MKNKSIVSSILIASIMVLYFVIYFTILIHEIKPSLLFSILSAIIPLAISGTMIYVTIERIREIKKGETDDLSKY